MQTKIKFGWLALVALLSWLTPAEGQGPVLLGVDPTTNTSVRALTFIDTVFADNVTGVDASDLLINGAAATNLLMVSPREYVFYFPQPPTGAVSVAWAPNHGITDLASPPNPFAGGSWAYTLDPNTVSTMLILSELLADNGNGIKDEDGARSDWLEIYNPGPEDANLGGWFLTDTSTNRVKWRVPSVFLAAGKYLLVWASGNDRTNPAAPLHTNFKLAKEGGYLALVNPQTNVVSAFNPYPAQQTDISYGRDRVDPNLLGYFPTPTPGAANVASGPSLTPEPVFSLETGVYTNASLTLSITAPFGTIRYTLNGTVPTNNSPIYTGPITFGTNVTIKARVFPDAGTGLFPSKVVAKNFLFLDGTTSAFDSNLPLLIINTSGRPIPADVPPGGNRVEGTLVVIDTFRGRSSIQSKPDFQGLAGFEIYGQTSAGFPKKPIRIEIHDELGNDLKVPLLGMPSDSDWRLRNPYDDKTLLNDFLGFELWEKLGHYSVRRRLVETFVDTGGGRLNYTADYYGVEVLLETIKQTEDRVNIKEITPYATNEPAVTGGYIFKKDKDSTGDLNFSTAGGGGFPAEALKFHEPKPNQLRTIPVSGALTAAGTNQLNYLRNYLNQMEKALYATNWLSLTGTNHYSYYLDVDSFVDFHWLVEFTKQIDGYRLSAYFTKDRNGKVQEGPVWDWNLSFGNANYLRGGTTNVWYYEEQDQGMTANEHIWLRRLINGNPTLLVGVPGPGGDPDFLQKAADRWGVLRTNILNGSNMLARIDELSTMLNEAQGRDLFGKYRSQVVGVYIWPNPDGTADVNQRDVDFVHPTNYLGNTTTTNSIIGQMKKWTMGRFLWIDGQFTPAPFLLGQGGLVPSGFQLSITGPPGSVVYYTLDGSDPRGPGGVTNGLLYTDPITVTGNVRVTARAKRGGSWYNTWSPPAADNFYTAVPPLRITELMFHPAPPPAGNTNDADNFEYIEVKNIGTTPLNLQRFRLSDGVQFEFPNMTLAAGQSGVVVADTAAFQSRYGSGPLVLGQYTGRLDNGGERIVLEGSVREPILDFHYEDSWYPITDGFGFSLVVVNEGAQATAWDTKAQWRPSGVLNGTPGQSETTAPSFPQVVINEALTHTEPAPPFDTIELRNLSANAANIGGWYLTDDFQRPKKFRIPNGTTVPANGYVTFDETMFNVTNVPGGGNIPFALSAQGDEVYLFSADTSSNLTGYVHGFDFGAQRQGATFGRYVTSMGEEHFVTQTSPTLGAANSGPLVGPVVITELMYRPPDVFINSAFWNNTEDEYVELRNITGSPVNLFDSAHPANTWKLDKAVEFSFAQGTSIPAHGFLLVVNFDPQAQPAQAAGFRSKYSVDAGVPMVGPYKGSLDNGDASASLYMPDAPTTNGVVPYVLVDRVHYSDHLPWPAAADGIGPSLQRIVDSAYGNDPTNWIAVGPTAGSAFVAGGTPPNITSQPTNTVVVGGTTAMLSVNAAGTPPLFYQWRFNGANIYGANNSTLMLPQVQPRQAGAYSVIVFNPAGSAESSNAMLTVLLPVAITQHPSDLKLRGSTNSADYGFTTNNATFNVAVGIQRLPTTYQWRFNGVPIPNATNTSLTIANVGLANDGTYDVVATDPISSARSNPARLTVLLSPIFLQVPANQTVVSNGSFSASVVIRGNPPPFRYEWREISNPRGSNYTSETTNFFSYGPITNLAAKQWRLVVFNDANPAPGALAVFNVTALPDSDGDGIPDANDLNPLDPGDATLDSDGDGVSNRAEYLAGTDPSDGHSYLKVDRISAGGGANVQFFALSNRTYTVEYTDGLSAPLWKRLADVVAHSADGATSVVDPLPGTNRFYRLVTPRKP